MGIIEVGPGQTPIFRLAKEVRGKIIAGDSYIGIDEKFLARAHLQLKK